MDLKGKKIGFGLTGSFCTFEEVIPQIEKLISMGATVIPILSSTVSETDTRYGEAHALMDRLHDLTGVKPICTIVEAEPLGPNKVLDIMIIAPCTGNTLAKLANAITDTPVLMAAKAILRNKRPLVLAISTNDALGANARNLGTLLNAKNIYMIPFGQDSPETKENSLVADMSLIPKGLEAALEGRQLQPMLIERKTSAHS